MPIRYMQPATPAPIATATWVYFETTVSPGAVGANPVATAALKVTDRAGTTTTRRISAATFSLTASGAYSLAWASAPNEGYWDDIVFDAVPPNVPSLGTPVAGASQIQWKFTPADNNFFGYEVADTGGTIVSPQYNASGWLTRSATSWTETGLTLEHSVYPQGADMERDAEQSFIRDKTVSTLSPRPGRAASSQIRPRAARIRACSGPRSGGSAWGTFSITSMCSTVRHAHLDQYRGGLVLRDVDHAAQRHRQLVSARARIQCRPCRQWAV